MYLMFVISLQAALPWLIKVRSLFGELKKGDD